MDLKTVSILGSTGSIGTQALDVARKYGFRINAIAGYGNIDLLEKQAREFSCDYVCVFDESRKSCLEVALGDTKTKVLSGMDGLCEISQLEETDILLNSVVGMVGLLPTLTAIRAKKDIALANKETLVAGGEIVMSEIASNNVKLYPVDSEHSAIFQCLQGNKREQLRKIILTASGGPFFGKTREELSNVTVKEALNHPNWSMGNKITIDSATLMNKGLEFIEAKWLFDLDPSQIEIVVHRQSVVHSAVEYNDYSVIAQLGVPDMKIPIQYALMYPDRMECDTKQLSLTDFGDLTFEKPDYETFSCLRGCIDAIEIGGASPCIANAANEIAVASFLREEISFNDIGELVLSAINHFPRIDINNFSDVESIDKEARVFTKERIAKLR